MKINKIFLRFLAIISLSTLTACYSNKSHLFPTVVKGMVNQATPNFGPNRGRPGSKFHKAVAVGNIEYVKKQVAIDPALIRRTEGFPRTAVMVAATNGQTEMLAYLLSEHAWPVDEACGHHAYGERHDSAIEYAVRNGHLDTARYLLQKGAILRTGKEHGQSMNRLSVLASMKSKDSTKRENWVEIAKWYIERGEDINQKAQDGSGKTALHRAAENQYPEMISFLLANGADINAKTTDYGHTPLAIAKFAKCTPCIDLLTAP